MAEYIEENISKRNNDYDVKQLASELGRTMETELANKRGRSKYRVR